MFSLYFVVKIPNGLKYIKATKFIDAPTFVTEAFFIAFKFTQPFLLFFHLLWLLNHKYCTKLMK